ncbi:hypothetical protein Mpop_2724 [Methylorubrum populi BJ001]|jgi:hypothetical protein|uniref:Uncharacterized protein n=1 Tax=Methylorubrum populi (strain ATCC BAA-705 / NCIMB 13946 / BJ001) TaxID=441620 RepID=B1ZD10_METPB|nr:hypothetical protein [Methylorubrum populi]ACB80879.1 hypothetical protein Mpop_2724 [Methylorubrum populi BJ001]
MPKAPLDPDERPARKDPPDRLKTEIFVRQGGRCYLSGKRLPSIHHCEWHHIPGLGVRPVRADGSDYEPAQLDPEYLFAVLPADHDEATNGPRVEKKHLLRKDHDKAKASRTKDLRASHREHVRFMEEKKPGQKRPKSGRWPKRDFPRRSK